MFILHKNKKGKTKFYFLFFDFKSKTHKAVYVLEKPEINVYFRLAINIQTNFFFLEKIFSYSSFIHKIVEISKQESFENPVNAIRTKNINATTTRVPCEVY